MCSYVYLLALLLLSGCGGFRGGIESVPYVGDIKPQQTSTHQPHEITLPGLTFHLSLNNTVRTYQYEVMLFIIPIYLNFWDEFQHRDAESLELTLQITAHDSDVTIDPRQLVLTVDGKEFSTSAVWVNNLERERQVIDAYVKARFQSQTNHPPSVPRSSEWRDAVTTSVTLLPGEQSPRFIVQFPVPLPSPTSMLSLEINQALINFSHSPLPVIQFKSLPWAEGYS